MAKAEIVLGELSGGSGNSYYEAIPTSSLSTTTPYTIDLGFEPKHVVLYTLYGGATQGTYVMEYDADTGKYYRSFNNAYYRQENSAFLSNYIVINGTTISILAQDSNSMQNTNYLYVLG